MEIENLQQEIEKNKKIITKKKAKQAEVTFKKNKELEELKKSKFLKEETSSFLKNKEDSLRQAIQIKELETKTVKDFLLEKKEILKSQKKQEAEII